MERTFQFVDVTRLDRATRRSMRSHAMRGKNAGKKFHRPSKFDLPKRRYSEYARQRSHHAPDEERSTMELKPLWTPGIAKSLGNVFLTLSLPLKLREHSLEVIELFFTHVADKMYPNQLTFSPDEHKHLWLQFMFSDEAVSHCSIALMEASNDFFLRKGLDSPEGLYHLSQTFTLVNKRLESEDALSDSTLAVIVMLIIQEQIRKRKLEAQVHYQGLVKMIDLRGGLGQLENNLPLLLKICKMDITYALQFGGPLHFFRDQMSETLAILASRGFHVNRTSTTRYNELDPCLLEILQDVTSIATLFNNLPTDQTMDMYLFQELVVSVCFRLISFRPIQGSNDESGTEAAFHIGLTAFMMTLFLQNNYRRLIDYDLVTLRLKEVLSRHLHELDDDLGVWLIFIGRAWTWESTDEFWTRRIEEAVQRLGVTQEADILKSVKKFPWINILHDKLSRMVWASMYEPDVP
ncbi:hypothetical protein GQ53DRAFT_878165 [Thozetella sp. PMI_491]|nr:hypothetical protein GQ53DRAFT_878165 [Thozetella sp. PMI_491]